MKWFHYFTIAVQFSQHHLVKPTVFSLLYILASRRQWHPTLVLLPGKFHGWRRLVGCSPWGCEESDMTDWLHFHFSLSCIGEGNGNPLQCSCLENPRDGEAWWAAVCGVAQSRTWLKWLSSSSVDSAEYSGIHFKCNLLILHCVAWIKSIFYFGLQ